MKRRQISATLLMAMALAGCGMNPTGVATPAGQKAGVTSADGHQTASAIEARYQALYLNSECDTTTGSRSTGTQSSTTTNGLED